MKPLFYKVKTATIEQTKKLGKKNFKESYKSFAIPPGYSVSSLLPSSSSSNNVKNLEKLKSRNNTPLNELAAKNFKDIDDGNVSSEDETYDSSNSSDIKLPRSPYPSSTYEDILDLRSPSSNNNNVRQLRRTVSFSDLEVSRKHDLKMAPTRIIMDIQTYTIYVDLKQKEASLKNLIEQLTMVSEEYSEHIEKLSNSYEEKFNNYKDTEKKGLEVLSKQKLIADRVNQIDTNSAKLNYELGVLEDKLKEIEEFIDNFCLKVKILESKMPQSPKSVKLFFNFWYYIQEYWHGFFILKYFNNKNSIEQQQQQQHHHHHIE